MIRRKIIDEMLDWKKRGAEKPLIVRGARQIGKTYVIKQFGLNNYSNVVSLNLEKKEERDIFEQDFDLPMTIELIELNKGIKFIPNNTLLFIDEIQYSPKAMMKLRYFYEDYPEYDVIAAGSLLEVTMKQSGFSFPVGRVEYAYMYPVTFQEYLTSYQKMYLEKILAIKNPEDISSGVHDLILKFYYEFLAIGSMPEAIAKFAKTKSYIDVNKIYNNIFNGFIDDVDKYSSETKGKYIQFVLNHSAENSGQLIKYENFANSNFKSREMREAMEVLENAMILNEIPATNSINIPILKNYKKSKKLISVDFGMMNYKLGLSEELLQMKSLNDCYRGQLAEQVVGQELLSLFQKDKIAYWYRDAKNSSAEVDFIIQHKLHLIPIEVKSGKKGRLRSLQFFMNQSKEKLAFRIYSGNYRVEEVEYLDKDGTYKLISLPFFLLFRIEEIFDHLIKEAEYDK